MKLVIRQIFAEPIIVAGMHRSGTTYFVKALKASGVFIGNHLDNNSESIPMIKYNEQVLFKSGLNWDEVGPFEFVPLFNLKYWLKHFLSYNKLKGISSIFKVLGRKKKWGWKDPRNTLTMRYWLSIFPKAKVIFIYRNGYDVAQSLYIRNNELHNSNEHYSSKIKSIESAFKLWEKYNAHFYQMANEIPEEQLLVLKYEDILSGNDIVMSAIDEFVKSSVSHHLKLNVKITSNYLS